MSQIGSLISYVIDKPESVNTDGDAEQNRFMIDDYTRSIQRLMEFSSGIIYGSGSTMDQAEIDLLMR